MQERNELRNRLIHEFAENYMEKLFYFCLKKTGNHTESEDLTQDISMNILKSINNCIIPTNFPAVMFPV